MAFYRLKDDLGKCPVYEIRGMRKQESPEDQEKEPVAGVVLIGFPGSTERMNVYLIQEPRGSDIVLPSILKLMLNLFSAIGKLLTRDGGSRFKGVNYLKSSKDLWRPVQWHSRLDPFPYSEPLTNLASYFGTHGISNVVPRNPLG
ncbi:hypothetical protein CRG98_006026 [Punica granatum]|uniref:Uncharacterized protein n=1 Tax=Punica granatum TaxID=22663 RepID=A0A2I0KYM1_PUNGR|nr:hypothetical protein CRG98_006026 [Punica granatum]